MIAELKEYLSTLRILNPKDVLLLAGLAKIKRFQAGDFVVRTGEASSDFFVVLRGALRNYAELANGDERTMRLSLNGMFTSNPGALFGDRASTESIVAIEDSLVACVNRTELEKLVRERPSLHLFYTHQLKHAMLEAHEQAWFHTVLTPEERYVFIRDKYPQFLQRVQIKFLASYIGVTPVSLSRIRARVARSGK